MTVKVSDYYADVESKLLVSRIVFSSSLDQGNMTQLQFVPPNSFILESERSESNKNSQQYGKVYGSDQ